MLTDKVAEVLENINGFIFQNQKLLLNIYIPDLERLEPTAEINIIEDMKIIAIVQCCTHSHN
jgi:hypothetical protein